MTTKELNLLDTCLHYQMEMKNNDISGLFLGLLKQEETTVKKSKGINLCFQRPLKSMLRYQK